MAGLCAIK